MATVEHVIAGTVEEVFDTIIDPETYPEWLYGARRVRRVDSSWPKEGSRFHHLVGLKWPLTIADSSEVLDIDRPRSLSLEVRFRPLGRAHVTFELRPAAAGDDPGEALDAGQGARTVLSMSEKPVGLLALLTPLLAPILAARNALSLRSLAGFVEQRSPVAAG